MPDISTRTKSMCGFIQFKGFEFFEIDTDRLKDFFDSLAVVRYGFAIHHLDLANDGDCVNPHIDFVVDLKAYMRISTMINKLAALYDVSPFAVTVSKTVNFQSRFQYVLHRNRPDKYQYPREYLFTNIDPEEADLILNSHQFAFDFDNLFDVISQARYLSEVISIIGTGVYHHYRNLIMDIWKETHNELGGVSPVTRDMVKERVSVSRMKYNII